MKIAIITRGLPGSGINKFIDRLKDSFNEMIIYKTDEVYEKKLFQKKLENFTKFLKLRDLIVLEGLNISPEQVYPFIKEAQKKRFKIVLVNFLEDKEENKNNIYVDLQLNIMKEDFKKYDKMVKELVSKVFEIKSNFFDTDVDNVIRYVEKMRKAIKSDYELSNRVKATLYILEKLIKTKKPLSAEDFENDEEFRKLTADAKKDNKPLSNRRIKDILNGLYNFYENIEVDIDNKYHTFKWIDKNDLAIKAIAKSDDISWILSNLNQSNPEILRDLEEDIKKLLKEEKDIFVFRNYIMENLEGKEEIFNELKIAVKNREKRKIVYEYNKKEEIEVNCLKLVFVDNNWYLAAESENKFRFLRLSFIKKVKPNYFDKKFKKSKKYDEFLNTFQNSLTLYGVEQKKARILATKNVAKYFKKDMKKFLPSQKFIKENEDGSVEFELSYTQPLEILPFIKRWLPDLIILSPEDLKNELKKDLQKGLEFYK